MNDEMELVNKIVTRVVIICVAAIVLLFAAVTGFATVVWYLFVKGLP